MFIYVDGDDDNNDDDDDDDHDYYYILGKYFRVNITNNDCQSLLNYIIRPVSAKFRREFRKAFSCCICACCRPRQTARREVRSSCLCQYVTNGRSASQTQAC